MEAKLPSELHTQFEHFNQQLVAEFGDRVPSEKIVQCAHRKLEDLHDARVLTFLPLLVYRYAREELSEIASATTGTTALAA